MNKIGIAIIGASLMISTAAISRDTSRKDYDLSPFPVMGTSPEVLYSNDCPYPSSKGKQCECRLVGNQNICGTCDGNRNCIPPR